MNRPKRYFCFFCNYEIRNKKYRIINYKNGKKMVCFKCTSSGHKALKQKYKTYKVDCSICSKVVKNNKCLPCSECEHFVHGSCNEISPKDILNLEKMQYFTCKTCINHIFPFSNEEIILQEAVEKTKLIDKNSKENNQCFVCPNIIENKTYKGKHIIYNSMYHQLCLACSNKKLNIPVRNIDLIEFVECSMCCATVKYEGIFCDTCKHWVHPHCVNLTPNNLKRMGQKNENWQCPNCTKIKVNEEKKDIILSMYNTHDDCSMCTKTVKTDNSINCSICKHWVHGKCIGLHNKQSFNTFIKHYIIVELKEIVRAK